MAAAADTRMRWDVTVGTAMVAAVAAVGSSEPRVVVVLGHGAGGGMEHGSAASLADVLNVRGLTVVRFNFPYREQGKSLPDPMPVLCECFSAVCDRARKELQPRGLVIGGHSLGGRAASVMASAGAACDGLLLFAYPLHPAGRPEKLRDEHLDRIAVPVLCFNGTRDELCRRDLMEQVLARVRAPWTQRWIEDGDHSFHVRRSSGRTDESVREEMAACVIEWLEALFRPRA